ncbi:unnamed protein product [Rangifer tarandus platyrhynchus]|uniref:Uncharacterized protein n=1 Tax=Rangifer tarandus platyrhynchus TaxID=3082113 RepID=A0AC60A9F1_RANTA
MKSQAQSTLHNRIVSVSCALLRARGARPRGDRGPLGTVTLPAASGLEVTRASRPRGGPAGARSPHPGPPQRALGRTLGRHQGQLALGTASGRKGGSTRQTPGFPRRPQVRPAPQAGRGGGGLGRVPSAAFTTGGSPLRANETAPARRAPRTAPRPRASPHFPASPHLARGGGRAPSQAPPGAHLQGPRLAPWPPARCGAARPRPPPPPPGRGSPTPRSPPPAAATAAPAHPWPGHSLATSPGAKPAVPHPPPASAARDCWYRPSLTPFLRPIQGLLLRGSAPQPRWAGLLDSLRTALLNPLRPGPAQLNSLDADSRLSCFSLPPHPAYIN